MNRADKYPLSKYREWGQTECASLTLYVEAEGTYEEVQACLQKPQSYTVWESVEDCLQDIRANAIKAKVEGLIFQVYSDSNRDVGSLAVEGTGYVLLTDKEKLKQEKKEERVRLAEAAALRKKIKKEKQLLSELLKKHPIK
jgi:hypothetical protein